MHKIRVFFDWIRSTHNVDYYYLHVVSLVSGDMVYEDYIWRADQFKGKPQDTFHLSFVEAIKAGKQVPPPAHTGYTAERIYLRCPTYNTDSAYDLDLNYDWRIK